jgi:3-phenylpropionate/trans-cinnamate dioxygenase ferredoxin subunit|nr:Rieske (2Fe-2S) protein [uncultured Pedobacter sp.]
MEWVAIAISSLSSADVQLVSIKGKRIVLVKDNNTFYAFTSKCPHAGGDLSAGWCKEGYLVCPIHRYSYNLKSGRGASGQGDYLKNYPVKTEKDHILIGFKKPWFKFW